MTFFAHFKSEQLWMVLVAKDNNSQHLETWIAPEGLHGVRRIFRNTRPDRMPLAAVSLKHLGQLGKVPEGMKNALAEKVLGEEQGVFVITGEDGDCRIRVQRGRRPADAISRSGYGASAVAAFPMDLVRHHAWTMRRLLDTQNFSTADANLLQGNGLPQHDFDEERAHMHQRPALWTKQAPGENDE